MRILVIEDEKEIREYLKSGLLAENYAVDTAEDGEKGCFFARTNNYDLIIMDNYLPGKKGWEICAELRKEKNNVPILMLSVNKDVETKVELLNIGADDYLPKPFSFEELLARTRALMRRPKKIEEEILIIDNLAVDTNNQTVKLNNKEIYLTKKEFALLEYLMRNIGRVLSRAVIMEHVWDMNADPFSNTVETHIRNLRRKLNKGNSNDFIHTVSGRGYKIC